jgi:hypothetical protein
VLPAKTPEKRRAQEQPGDAAKGINVTEQIQSLKDLIVRLIGRNKENENEFEKQAQGIRAFQLEIGKIRRLLQKNGEGKATYAATFASGIQQVETATTAQCSEAGAPVLLKRVRVEDDRCAITINTSRFKGEKADFVRIKAALQHGFETLGILGESKLSVCDNCPARRSTWSLQARQRPRERRNALDG